MVRALVRGEETVLKLQVCVIRKQGIGKIRKNLLGSLFDACALIL